MKANIPINRRNFVKGMIAGAGIMGCSSWLGGLNRASAAVPASEKINVAVIGLGGMGSHHLNSLLVRNDVNVIAVCDVYKPRYEDALKRVNNPSCKGFQDYRRVLDLNDLDAIWCATPDHWHALIGIHACEAGKDVYVEKPMTTTIHEGQKLVETARRYGRVTQVGIQQRSMPVFQKAIELVRNGALGQVTNARTWIGPSGNPGPETPSNPPDGLDWDLWLGPAPWVPFSPQRFGGFRAFHDYASGGELANWGPHLLDIARWGLNQEGPLHVVASGASYVALDGDDQEIIEVVYETQGGSISWVQAPSERQAGKGYGIMFQGMKGRLIVDRESYEVQPLSLGVPAYTSPYDDYFIRVQEHHSNFLDCIRSRQRTVADVEVGHKSTLYCHLGNLVVELKRNLTWDDRSESFIGDEDANRFLFRPYRHPWHL